MLTLIQHVLYLFSRKKNGEERKERLVFGFFWVSGRKKKKSCVVEGVEMISGVLELEVGKQTRNKGTCVLGT